jgi:hypothetical protein
MKRPVLNEIPLNGGTIIKRGVIVTMSVGQWDGVLEAAYDRGHILLELDDNEIPVRVYQRPVVKQ